MSKKFDYLIYIGRFQIAHNGHIHVIKNALSLSERVIIIIGSAFQPSTIKNPFTFDERRSMLQSAFSSEDVKRLDFTYVYDYLYNDQKWAADIQNRVSIFSCNPNAKIGIIGCKKDSSSYYLEMFPQWQLVEVDHIDNINATDCRNKFFTTAQISIDDKIPQSTVDFLIEHIKYSETYKCLVKEYNFIEMYKSSWDCAPYPPVFVTVDAVVIQSGHILLVKRKALPGKGLWALPGVFIDQNETTLESMIRELREETGLKVPVPVLKGSIKDDKVFDNPNRSLRGRTITHAYLLELANGELHKVKGGDDALKAKWIQLSKIQELRETLFEDHMDIITYFADRL